MNWENDQFPPDAVEEQIPDVATAYSLLEQKDQACLDLIADREKSFHQRFAGEHEALLKPARAAFVLAYARFAMRHGSWGDDFHAYHNEAHTLEIFDRRINALCNVPGNENLEALDWVMLSLFAATHDLRQREPRSWDNGVGANERASMAEARRILQLAGFQREKDAEVFLSLDMMIAGSTFDTNSGANNLNSSDAVTIGGALAPTLVARLQKQNDDWRSQQDLVRRMRLTLVASDLDTANVGEPFALFAESAARLCKEREMRLNRADLGKQSASHVLNFLTDGQEHYFHNLHQFDSKIGASAFGEQKKLNAPRVHAMSLRMREKYGADVNGTTGIEIIEDFMQAAEAIDP